MALDAAHRYRLEDLLTLMRVLRDPEQGCPWDIKQGWDSIVPHTLEEAYEVADAIERRAFDELPGELGDLLFQVIYYAQFGSEEGLFDFATVLDTLMEKMLRRHPHVFPDGTLASRRPPGVSAEAVQTQTVNRRWEALKAEERAERREDIDKAPPSALDDVPRTLPALSRAAKLSKRAAGVGFDWDDARGVLAKIREELDEVEEALDAGDDAHAREEVGDVLFAVTNLARRLKVDPEQCLRATNAKFERRFRYVETQLALQGKHCRETSLKEMERHWQTAKVQERS
ncbi:nucleoside triphosphate pyrophosphohydrolase [Halomonas dongshanensis]|uniref:Nucleoside triphosphate pyrophosphohydrolase n=1 Tax=Halomonas dongshanensis TaxID=2890835 RepID=A0ABT2EHN2_9GAMM|nr:nucleoside triphosphate pyrophosphohydrolase [Halomonas dongshanensis]MCS2610114.1 nucleoside triphosphate pyrophosphohydrolase [Halomonas dongshanensis]